MPSHSRQVLRLLPPLLLAVVAGCASLRSHPPSGVDLSGTWKLNESMSDDPQALMRMHHQGGGGHGMPHRGGMSQGGMSMPNLQSPPGLPGASGSGGYGVHGGHHGGGSHGGYGGGQRHGGGNEFLARPAEMDIHQQSEQLRLVADGVPTDYLYGDKVMASVQNGAAERTSGWKGKDFVVKYEQHDGPTATRTYSLNDGGRHLVLTTELSGGPMGNMKFNSVYERQPGG